MCRNVMMNCTEQEQSSVVTLSVAKDSRSMGREMLRFAQHDRDRLWVVNFIIAFADV